MVDASSMKLWWRLWLRDSFWAEFMFNKYIQEQHPLMVDRKGSHLWKRRVNNRDQAESQIIWCVGIRMIDFWHDCWVRDDSLASLCQISNLPHSLVAEFFFRRWME